MKNSRIHQNNDITCVYVGLSQQTKNICITFIQRRLNVFDVGPTLYKCYTNILCLLWCAFNWNIIRIYFCLFPDICLADAGATFSRPGIKPLGGLLWWPSASKKQVNCFTHFLRYVLHQQDYLFLIDDTFWKKILWNTVVEWLASSNTNIHVKKSDIVFVVRYWTGCYVSIYSKALHRRGIKKYNERGGGGGGQMAFWLVAQKWFF